MIYLAQYGFGSYLEGVTGRFSFMAEAASQEEAEMKLVSLLKGAVQNERWFLAPCRILLTRLAVMDAIPATGIAFHQWFRHPDFIGDGMCILPMAYLPPQGMRILYDWDNVDWSKSDPVPLIFVERDRTLSFPTENVPPALW